MNINLICPCIIYLIYTLYLLKNCKTNDKYILIIMILGQLILLCGSLLKNNILIEISHIIYTITIILGVLFFTENINNIFLFIIILITLITRKYFEDCLFNIASNSTILINIDINFDHIYIPFFIIIIYKLIDN